MCGILKEVLEDEPLWTKLFAEVQTEEDDAKVADIAGARDPRRESQARPNPACHARKPGRGPWTRQIRSRTDVAALRAVLMADNGCLLLATAPLHFDGITDVNSRST